MKELNIQNKNRYYSEIENLCYNWWKDTKKLSLEETRNYFEKTIIDDSIPIIKALIINDTLIGFYEINEKDDIDNEPYTPYLANVYVKEQYRHQGYGSIMIKNSIQNAKELGYKKLYLHSHLENYYEQFGFKFLKEVDTKYGKKRIYELDIEK